MPSCTPGDDADASGRPSRHRERPPIDPATLVAPVLGLGGLWAAALLLFWVLRPRGLPTRELLRLVPDVLRLLRGLLSDRGAPLDVRLVLVALIAWIVSPVDLIPEFIPVLGPLDDVVVAIVALRYVRRRMGVEALRERWPGTNEGFELLARVIG